MSKTEFRKEFDNRKEELQTYLNDEYEHMADRYGITDGKEKELMLAYFLYNCHDIISSIASEFTDVLSKSTYSKEVYISKIHETQEEHYETYHYEDIMEFISDEDVTREDIVKFIDEYFSNREEI